MSKIDNDAQSWKTAKLALDLVLKKKNDPANINPAPQTQEINPLSKKDQTRIESTKTTEQINFSFNEKENTGSKNTGFVDLNTAIQNFDEIINSSLKNSGTAISPYTAKDIFKLQVELKNILIQNNLKNPDDVKKLGNILSSLVIKLNSNNLLNQQCQENLNILNHAILDKIGSNNGMSLKLETVNDKILGLSGTSIEIKSVLKKEQQDILSATSQFCLNIEKIKSEKGLLTANAIVLMGLRDELLRLSFETISRTPDKMTSPEPIYKDMGIISKAVASIDEMLKDTRNLPSEMTDDMNKIVGKMLDAPKGQIEDALKDFALTDDNNNSIQKSLNQLNEQLSKPFSSPEILDNLEKLKSEIANSNLPDKNSDLNVIEKIESQLGPNGIQKNISEAVNKLNDSLSKKIDNKDISKSSDINKANNSLLDIVRGTPRGIADGVKNAVTSYSSVMNKVQKSMPPFLPRPVTMLSPIAYDDGKGNSFILPAGSKISKIGGGYQIQSPSLFMGFNGTTVDSGQTTIQLGNNGLDNLQLNNLTIKNGDSNTVLTGFKSEINRNTGSSYIKADSAVIDTTTGHIVLTNGSLNQASDGSLSIDADSFVYDKDNNHANFSGFHFGQTESAGKSTLNGSANTININMNNTVISADKMSVEMVHDDNSSIIDQTHITGENLNVVNNGTIIKAAKASVDIEINKDGSSSTVFTAENPTVKTATGNLDITGQTVLALTQDKDGKLSTLSATADKVKYTDQNGVINASGGNLKINYDPAGNVKGISAKAATVDYTGKDGNIAATGGNLDITYGPNNFLKTAVAHADSFNYNGTQGNLAVTNGNINLNYDDNGNPSFFKADAKDVNWTGASGEKIMAGNSSIDASFYDNGKINQINTSTGSLNYTSKDGEILNVTNGAASVTMDKDGWLSKATGKADKIDYTGKNGDKVNATGLDINITGDKNGINNASVKVGTLNYLSGKGENIDVTNGSLNIDRDPKGFISNAAVSADKLNYKGISGDSIKASGLEIKLTGDENGIRNASVKAGQIDYTGVKGEKLNITNGSALIDRDEQGFITNAKVNADKLDYTGINGENVKATGLDINITGDKNGINNANIKAGTINYLGNKGEIAEITNGSLNINKDEKGVIKNVSGSADKFLYQGSKGDRVNAEGIDIKINNGPDGIKDAAVKVGKLDYLNEKGDKILVTNGQVNLTRDDGGFISNLNGKADLLNYTGINGDKINATGLGININGDKDGLKNAGIKVGSIDYTGNKGETLNLLNGSFNVSRDSAGFISNANGKADSLTYTGVNGDKINAAGLNININGNKDGITDATVKVGQLDYLSTKGDAVKVTNGSVALFRDTDGFISKVSGHADLLTFTGKDGNTLTGNGIDINLLSDKKDGKDNYNFKATATSIEADLKKQELNLKANNIIASLDNDQMKVHVDSVEVLKKLGEELNVKIDNLDLIVDKNKDGAVKGLDLQVAGVEGKIKGMELHVTTVNGERLRLNMAMSEDGKFLKEAYLKIPTGGEIQIKKDDLDIKLGEQKITFTQDGKGLYTLRDDGLKIDAVTKDAKIHVEGGSAQVSLDANTGNIIIDEIKGIKVNALIGKNNVDVNIKEINGFLIKMTGLEGPVKGAMIELKPTGDNSRMTASIRANVSGIPIKVDFDDIHELKMLGSISENEVHVYAGDPSGKGHIAIGAGPLKVEGSAVEFLGRYNQYDSQRMMSTMSRYLSTDGFQAGAFSLEPDGVVRVEKQSSGLHLGASLLLPRSWENRYDFSNNIPDKDGSWGLITSIGGQGKTKDGTKYVGNLFAGLVPGSYLSLDRLQGNMTLFNIPIPSHTAIPTTVVAGLGFRRHSDESRLDISLGAYANPVGFVPADSDLPLKEKIKYGAFGGFNYRTSDYQIGVEGLADLDKNNKITPGFRVGVGFSF
jgi:hypothetical protein